MNSSDAFRLFFPTADKNGKKSGGYSEPLRSWQFSVSADGIGSVWVQGVGFKLTPSVSIEYLGNPMFGKPRRMLKYDTSQLGDLTIDCTDEATNANMRAFIGKLESHNNIASGKKPVKTIDIVQYIQAVNPITKKGSLVPYIHYRFGVTLNDLVFSDFTDDNGFSTLHAVMKIDNVSVYAFPRQDYGLEAIPQN